MPYVIGGDIINVINDMNDVNDTRNHSTKPPPQ